MKSRYSVRPPLYLVTTISGDDVPARLLPGSNVTPEDLTSGRTEGLHNQEWRKGRDGRNTGTALLAAIDSGRAAVGSWDRHDRFVALQNVRRLVAWRHRWFQRFGAYPHG